MSQRHLLIDVDLSNSIDELLLPLVTVCQAAMGDPSVAKDRYAGVGQTRKLCEFHCWKGNELTEATCMKDCPSEYAINLFHRARRVRCKLSHLFLPLPSEGGLVVRKKTTKKTTSVTKAATQFINSPISIRGRVGDEKPL